LVGPYGTGEVLLGTGFLLPFGAQVWTGPGSPASFPITVPPSATLIGVEVYLQGLIAELGSGYGVTRARAARIGF
jgi:hypothetical protein